MKHAACTLWGRKQQCPNYGPRTNRGAPTDIRWPAAVLSKHVSCCYLIKRAAFAFVHLAMAALQSCAHSWQSLRVIAESALHPNPTPLTQSHECCHVLMTHLCKLAGRTSSLCSGTESQPVLPGRSGRCSRTSPSPCSCVASSRQS